ncbi:MAG: ribosome hibernation-promoting factor, HPF/YfiA family [Planctomycetota bacterium]
MSTVVKARHMDVPDDVREYVEAKAEKLHRYLGEIRHIEVTLDVEAEKAFVEVLVTAKRKATFVATHLDDDMHASIDQCFHKISEQLRRYKDRVRDRQGLPHSETMTPPE